MDIKKIEAYVTKAVDMILERYSYDDFLADLIENIEKYIDINSDNPIRDYKKRHTTDAEIETLENFVNEITEEIEDKEKMVIFMEDDYNDIINYVADEWGIALFIR